MVVARGLVALDQRAQDVRVQLRKLLAPGERPRGVAVLWQRLAGPLHSRALECGAAPTPLLRERSARGLAELTRVDGVALAQAQPVCALLRLNHAALRARQVEHLARARD